MSKQTASLKDRKFEYNVARMRDFKVNSRTVIGASKRGWQRGPKVVVDSVEVDGQTFGASKRFWTSVQSRFGFSSNIFRYFNHAEVFNRISQVAADDRIRFCVENKTKEDGTERKTLLAVTNPAAPAVRFENLQDLFNKYGVQNIGYTDGVVRSTHQSHLHNDSIAIAGDAFKNQFIIDTPIDGFGKPDIYLSLMRLVCSNGMVGFSPTFRSELNIGKNDSDVMFALMRAMEGFNNEDGFLALHQRFESASRSWASVSETERFYRLLNAQYGQGGLRMEGREVLQNGDVVETALPIFQRFHKMTGDLHELYGLANLDSLSNKRQRTLPTACKVYDLLNFATEVATHKSTERGNRALQGYVGTLISSEYDLEGTVDSYSNWQDFFVETKPALAQG